MADDTLKLRYLRIEERAKPSRQISYYRGRLKTCIEHPLTDGVHLDGLLDLPNGDGVRSVDVLITPASAADSLSTKDDPQPLTIEILTVEVHKLRE